MEYMSFFFALIAMGLAGSSMSTQEGLKNQLAALKLEVEELQKRLPS